MIEQIYNCETCRNYSKSIAKEMHEEIFSLALEKIIVSKPKKVDNYKSYFYRVLKNVYIDYVRSKHFCTDDIEGMVIALEEEDNNYKLALETFLSRKDVNEETKFYQDLIYLSFENSESTLGYKLGMKEVVIRDYMNKAKELIKYEYDRLINN